MDHAQHDLGEGPCLDTRYGHRTVRLPDLATERRWPRFAERARKLGVGSVLAVQLFVDGTDLGARNLLSRDAHAFGDESGHVALLSASHASVALSGEQAARHRHRPGADRRAQPGLTRSRHFSPARQGR
jgi:hypothetical protein